MHSGHLRNFFSFGALQAVQLLIPLAALPWLGRKLGPEAFGLLMYMAILPPIVYLFMDWGMSVGAVRLCSRARGQPEELRILTGSVFSAKIILALTSVLLCAALFPFIPHAPQYPIAYWLAIAVGISRGINPLWYFQGLGAGITKFALWDIAASLAALCMVFIFIKSADDWQLYLLFLSVCKGSVYLVFNMLLWRASFPPMSIRLGVAVLCTSSTLFTSSLCVILYNYGSQLVLGYFLPAAQMGLLVAINKMLRAIASAVLPFTQIILPEVCAIRENEPDNARRMLRLSAVCLPCLMSLLAAVVWMLAPRLLSLALGQQYANGAHVLRIMIIAAPFMAISQVLGTQILAAYNLEKAQVLVQGCVGAASLVAAPFLAMAFGLEGGAFLNVCVEAALAVGYLTAVIKLCPDTLWKK